jgi:hypothetical protein
MLLDPFIQLSASFDEATGLNSKPVQLGAWGSQLWNKILGPSAGGGPA